MRAPGSVVCGGSWYFLVSLVLERGAKKGRAQNGKEKEGQSAAAIFGLKKSFLQMSCKVVALALVYRLALVDMQREAQGLLRKQRV